MRFPSAGSHLRDRYGPRYRSIGFTFDHARVDLGEGQTAAMPPPAPTGSNAPWAPSATTSSSSTCTPPPAATRGLAQAGPGSFVDGGGLSTWFDVPVHRQEVGPTHPL